MKLDGDVIVELLDDAFGVDGTCPNISPPACGLPALADDSGTVGSHELLVVGRAQRDAVSHLRGKLLVLAGPGWTDGAVRGLASAWAAVPGAAPERALAHLLGAYMKAMEWKSAIGELLESGGSVKQLLDASVEAVGNPLMYYDDQLRELTYAATPEDDEIALQMYDSHSTFREGSVPLEMFDNDMLQESLSHDGVFIDEGNAEAGGTTPRTLNAPVRGGGVRAIVGMVPLHDDIKAIHRWYLSELARALSRHYRNVLPTRGDVRIGVHGIVRGLLDGTVDLRLAHRQLSILLNDFHCFACVAVTFPSSKSQGMPLAYLASKIERVLGGPSALIDYGGGLVALLSAVSDDELDALAGRLFAAVSRYGATVGLSTPFDDPLMVSAGYLKACRAVEFGQTRGLADGICRFSDVVVDYILHFGTTELGPRDLMAPGFIRLLDYDSGSSVDYCETLRLFCRFNGNVSRVARECSVNRSTLLFRLGQIEQVTSMRLDDAEDLLWLRLSLRLLQS